MKTKTAIHKLYIGVLTAIVLMGAPVILEQVLTSLGAPALSLTAKAHAQARKNPGCDRSKPRRTPAMTEKVFKELGKAAELASPEQVEGQPEAKPDFRGALKVLKRIEKKCADGKCNKYELASIYNYFGWVYYSLNNSKNAIAYYKKLVAQVPEIPKGLELQTYSTLAKLSLQEERLNDSLQYINKWLSVTCDENPEMYQLRSTIHYFKNDKINALKDISRAVRMVESAGKTPKEAWWSLQKSLLLEKEDYRASLPILTKMVRHYPKFATWDQMASVYGVLGQGDNQRHALDAVYQMGGFERETQYINLAHLYLGADVPYKAAKVLHEGIKEKIVKNSTKNLKIVAQAYAAAQEVDKSIPVMEKAAASAEDGELYAHLVRLYLNKSEFKKAVLAGKKAIKKKKIRRAGQLHLNIGIAYFEQKKYESAIKSFDKAKEYDATSRIAITWRRHTVNEWDREKKLAEFMKES